MFKTARLFAGLLAAIALAAAAGPSGSTMAQPAQEVDLALVLAVDVSNSVDRAENALQRAGYVEALAHPDIWTAIRSGPLQRIALTYVEWAGPNEQRVVIPWRLIDSPDAAPHLRRRPLGPSDPLCTRHRHIDLGGDQLQRGPVPRQPLPIASAGDRPVRRRSEQSWRAGHRRPRRRAGERRDH